MTLCVLKDFKRQLRRYLTIFWSQILTGDFLGKSKNDLF